MVTLGLLLGLEACIVFHSSGSETVPSTLL